MERLQKVIAESGLTSRRKAEELITAGKVKVNGQIVTELGTKVTNKDRVEVNGKPIEKEQKEIRRKINKIKEKGPEGIFSNFWTLRDSKNKIYDKIETSKRNFDRSNFEIMLQGSKQTVFRFLYRNNKAEKKFDCRSECSTILNK